MHILYIMGQDSGGLPHYTAELANAVAEECRVTVLKPSTTTADELFDDDVQVISAFEPTEISMQNIFEYKLNVIKNVRGILSYRRLSLVNELDPDLVHDPTDEFPQVSLFSYLTGAYKDRSYVVTKHEVKHGDASPVLKLADFVMSLIPDFPKAAAVVHSEKQRDALAEQHRNFDRIETIPHGVYSFFKECDYAEQQTEDNHVLFFGSLIPPKGVEFLIRAVPLIVEEIPDFTLTIAGSGKVAKNCQSILDEYRDHIDLRNEYIPNEQVGTLFSRAQLVALPYREGWQTGHSGSLSTAFAFGKPVIASAVGDFPRLIDESGAGMTVAPEDPEALAAGIVGLLTDTEKLQRMADESERMGEELSWESIGQLHVELYRELLDGDATGSRDP